MPDKKNDDVQGKINQDLGKKLEREIKIRKIQLNELKTTIDNAKLQQQILRNEISLRENLLKNLEDGTLSAGNQAEVN